MRARPVRFSESTGLRLCGIAEEPFCPSEKNSSASSTSVRCRCRISVASRSTEEATTPSVAKNIAWRSRGITCVETGSTARPILAADGRRHLVLEGAPLERIEQLLDIRDQDVGGARGLHVETGVEGVGGGHPLMHEARLGPDDFGKVGQECDGVMLGFAFDLVD